MQALVLRIDCRQMLRRDSVCVCNSRLGRMVFGSVSRVVQYNHGQNISMKHESKLNVFNTQ